MGVSFADSATFEPGPRPGLGTDANSVTPFTPSKPSAAVVRELRRLRFARRQQSRAWLLDDARAEHGDEAAIHAPRPAKCGWASGAAVGVHRRDEGQARYSGVQSCASIWSCPHCASIIRARRADEVQHAADWWERQQGGSFLFATFTVRHYREDTLQRSLKAVTDAFTRVIRGAPWKRFAARHGIRHTIKAVEVTLGWENGWHAHLHVLFFTERPSTARELREADGWLSARWADMVVKAGGRRPSKARGVDVRTVQDGNIVADYLTKLQEATDRPKKAWKVGQEMARIDAKKGRLESLVPFELLDVEGLDADEVERNAAHWVEYVATTKGRRAMTWSRGLKDACGLEEVDDEEVVAEEAEETEADDLRVIIRREHWRTIQNNADVVARILELVELQRIDEITQFVPILLPDADRN